MDLLILKRDKQEVRKFVFIAIYYRKYIVNYAELIKPLNKVMRKNREFEWSEECQNAYEKIKSELLTLNKLMKLH